MKHSITLIISLISVISVLAQNGSIEGKVQDAESNDGIPFATIALYKSGSEVPVTGVSTDYDGNFNLSGIAYGSYHLAVSFIGYTAIELPNVEVSRALSKVNLGTINLTPSATQLEGVEVSAMARTVANRLDRRTYRAEDFKTTRGGNAADVLNRLPSVSVSPEGDVFVRGTTDFMVYLNGRPTQLEPSVLLAQISAGSIESIDVITVPSAQFDAQGKGGIINITTKTSGLEGFSLSANGLLGGAPWGHRTDRFTGYNLNDNRYGGGLNLVYANNGWVFYGGLNYNWRDANSSRTGDARILDPNNGSYKHMVASGMKPEWYENISSSLGFDAKLSSKSNFSASYYYGKRTEWRQAFYMYNIFTADKDKNPIDGVSTNEQWTFNPNEGVRTGSFHTANADYSYSFNESTKLSLSGLYEFSVLTHDVDNPNIEYNPTTEILGAHLLHYRQSDSTPLKGLRFSVDLIKKFDNGNILSLGAQPQFFTIEGGLKYDTLNVGTNSWGAYTDLENEVDLTRAIYAGYVDYSGTLGKLNYKAGLRLEYTDQVLKIDNPDYFTLFDRQTIARNEQQKLDWFPSLHGSYSISERDNVMFAASRRISRSPVKNMAPFLYRRHLEVYVVGDPELKPEYINNVELSYGKSIGKQRLNLTGFYRGVTNAVFRVNTVFEDELVLIRTFTNSGNTQSIGAELNANLELGKRIKMFVGGSLYDYRISADIFGYREEHHGLAWSVKGNANVLLARGLRFSADFDVKSAVATAQGRNELGYIANAALSYNPSNLQGWTFNLRGLNLLNSNTNELNTRAYNQSGVQIFYQDTEFYWYGPIVELGISYNLNWKGQTKKADSEFGRSEF